jgi:hypothetical protein
MQIMGAEVFLMVGTSVALAAFFGFVLAYYGDTWLQNLVLRGS